MRQRVRKLLGFTLTELLIVVIIMGILAGFSLPNYTRSVKRARARDALNNLTAIHAAQLIYRSSNSVFRRCIDVTAINNLNGTATLNVIQNGATYSCNDQGVNPPTVCRAVAAGDFTVTVTLASAINPGANPLCSSSNGSCP
jgi:prepilin-type N-terminal cleavage/methylation domain-containing protein